MNGNRNPNWVLVLVIFGLVLYVAVQIGQRRSDAIVKPEQEQSELIRWSVGLEPNADEPRPEEVYTRKEHREDIKDIIELNDAYFGHKNWRGREEVAEGILD